MHQTYELYFQDEDGDRRFEALTCTEPQLLSTVQRRLAEEGAGSVEVRQFGTTLFTLNR
jgi:methionine synthase I (cobalamin-dependent)